MKPTKFTNAMTSVKTTVSKHSPEILTGFGIVGMLTTTVLAVRATPKALRLIEEAKEEYGVEKLSVKDTIKVTYKCYLPAATLAVTSTACLIGANSISLKRNAALATAYKLVETANKEYREKVIETIGEEKEREIKEKVHQSHADQNPVSAREVVITGRGDTLCYDCLSGRYFMTDVEDIRRAVNDLNRRMLNDNFISLNEFYNEIGLDSNKIGNLLGWNIDKGYIDLHFSSILTDKNEPCLVVDFSREPVYDYDDYH